jgi:hypothetical protein
MAEDPLEPFATRIPADLHYRVNVFRALRQKSIQDFTREAFEEKLAREDALATGSKNIVEFRATRTAKNQRRRR